MSEFKSLFLINNKGITSPALNLAIEEYATRHLKGNREFLFIYRNSSAVIIGKHQNPFRESNIRFINNESIPMFRRISGGGTVYHDPGNINVSFIGEYTPSKFNNYSRFIKPVVELLKRKGANAALNRRNDILINGLKVSGNAQFTSRDRMLSHGTLLYEADLKTLKKSLETIEKNLQSRSTPSIRSSVTNILPNLKHPYKIEQFMKLVAELFPVEDIFEFSDQDWSRIHILSQEKYNSWGWNYGQTPPFKISVEGLPSDETAVFEIQVRQGVVSEISYHGKNEKLRKVFLNFKGKRFMFEVFKQEFKSNRVGSENQINRILDQLF